MSDIFPVLCTVVRMYANLHCTLHWIWHVQIQILHDLQHWYSVYGFTLKLLVVGLGSPLTTEHTINLPLSCREFVSVLEPYVQLEEEFVKNFMQKPRSCYEACFHEGGEDKLKVVHPEGNLLAILQEVRRTVLQLMMLIDYCMCNNPLICACHSTHASTAYLTTGAA